MKHTPVVVMNETTLFSLGETCRICGVHAEWVLELVEEGIVEPRGGAEEQWRFDLAALARVRSARRLRSDLGINTPGIGLALELLDELNQLRRRHKSRLS